MRETLNAEYRCHGAPQAVFFDVKSGIRRNGNSLPGTSVVVSS